MLTIRLQRAGKRNKPEFRIVLAEKESSASKKFAEILGSYNPRTKSFSVKEDRVRYWISQRVVLSPTVHNLFVTQKLVDAPKVKAFSIPAKKEESASAEAAAPAPAPATGTDAEAPAAKAQPAAEPVEAAPAEPPPAETPAEQTPAE
jgi:small subunit ribosomal protein S16